MKLNLRPKLTYANAMSTIAVFLAMGGGAFAASNYKSPVKVVQKAVIVSAAYADSNGNTVPGTGTGAATCPKNYTAVGGGFVGLTTTSGAITPTTSARSAKDPRKWIVWFDSYSSASEVMYVSATCVRDNAL